MKSIFVLALFLWSSISVAQTPPRDVLIDRVESIYFQATLYSPDSPSIELLFEPVKDSNPDVSNDTWLALKKEFAPAIAKAMTERGGPLDTAVRNSLRNLSDAELDKLCQILSDPVYSKFQGAIGNRSSQTQFLLALGDAVLKMTDAVNSVLTRHGLKKIH
ncbi:MAG: hypothetical protein WC736_08845 [Gallionella sp.]|jgi:hypothetical protein